MWKRLKSENFVKTRRDVGPCEAGMKNVNFLIEHFRWTLQRVLGLCWAFVFLETSTAA